VGWNTNENESYLSVYNWNGDEIEPGQRKLNTEIASNCSQAFSQF
jgi:hypothetical protein